jgi:uncharacterized membrane protein YbhN (UPF0104 family)
VWRVAVVGLVTALFVRGVPLLSGVRWHDLATALAQPAPHWYALLVVLWLAGLCVHTVTLTAALPRLTHRRALTLSLTGSAVANVLPVGGAAGVALNYRMLRSWGFDRAAFGGYTVVTNLWDVLSKLCLPALALAWLSAAGVVTSGRLVGTTAVTSAALVVVSALTVLTLTRAGVATRVGSWADAVLHRLARTFRIQRDLSIGPALVELQSTCAVLVRSAWARLTLGMTGYLALLAALLAVCLHLTGAGVALPVVFAGFAFERVLTLPGITPGGAGVVEVGVTGLLIALGGDPLGVATGVLLYRAFSYGMEIPVGAGLLALWWRSRGRLPEVGAASSAAASA